MTPDKPRKTAPVDKTEERILARSKQRGDSPATQSAKTSHGVLREIRGWSDALFFAFVLAMFIRTYVFELFMIPTGSMTPALIGDEARQICEFDWDEDGDEDIVVVVPYGRQPVGHLQVHVRNDDGEFETELLLVNPEPRTAEMFHRFRGFGAKEERNRGAGRRDMIMVNKFAYWFSEPTRGDIIVFKVPDRPPQNRFDPSKPVYIKRCMGLPGEEIVLPALQEFDARQPGDADRISPDEYGGIEFIVNTKPVVADGAPVAGDPFDRLHHFRWESVMPYAFRDLTLYPDETISVSDNAVLMFGDNQFSSSDSRVWGEVPLSHLRGKAILRYWPLRTISFLDNP